MWSMVARRVARQASISSRVRRAISAAGVPGLEVSLRDLLERDLLQIGHDGAVLVRPDGYVAWRNASGPFDGAPLIHAVEQILDHRP